MEGGGGRYERGTRRAGSYLRERVLICTMGGRWVTLVGRVRLLLLLVLQRILIRNRGHLPLMHGLERWKDNLVSFAGSSEMSECLRFFSSLCSLIFG